MSDAADNRAPEAITASSKSNLAFALACLPDWPNERQAIARACILNGRSVRDAATALRLTLSTVRRELQLINDLYREAEAMAEVQR